MIDIETSNAIQKQMLDKMGHYRAMLRKILSHVEGGHVTASEVREMILQELLVNPEYEVLKHLPHMEFPGPDAYRAINTGPKLK